MTEYQVATLASLIQMPWHAMQIGTTASEAMAPPLAKSINQTAGLVAENSGGIAQNQGGLDIVS